MNREKKNYEVMKRWIDEEPGRKIITGGDFNARSGEVGIWGKDYEREDRKNGVKVINQEGKIT